MEFYDLSDNELKELLSFDFKIHCLKDITFPNVREVIRKELNYDRETNLFMLKEHSYGCYWKRQIDKSNRLGEDIFSELLRHLFYETAKCVLGDCAIDNKLSEKQCQKIIEVLDQDERTVRLVKARLRLESLKKMCLASENTCDPEDIMSVLEEIINLRAAWAVIEIIPMLTPWCLRQLNTKIENNVFSRSNRHKVRVLIEKQLRVK